MPPKAKFTKEAIVDAALAIADREGLDAITIRKIADELGSSIAPIYVNFKDVEELKDAVLVRIFDLSAEMARTPYSPDPFLSIGIASLKFAREHPALFRELAVNNHPRLKDVQTPVTDLLSQMKGAPKLAPFSEEELMGILFKMRIFQLGLSVMDINGSLPGVSEETLVELLRQTGEDLIAAELARKQAVPNDPQK
ncbi:MULTISPECIES: TetR/AcrR family transcriptional regulator [Cohnella]|uniref:TetR family transcriptional regulator n=1 Tax=Cohnella phaseoli TaxID=456490 RepID=A0A3D9KCI9_9BACL|nr:TetR/AcrR family transcriptional regulator [Cohnella phaseoli]RED84254.1 TetR family transcriptional regulator [Cohnella phaseoli]